MTNYKEIVLISSEFPPGPGGIGNHAYNLAKFLQKEGFTISVITNQENSLDRDVEHLKRESRFKIIYVKRYRFLPITYFLRIFFSFRLLFRRADIICICTGKFSLWNGACLKALGFKNLFIGVLHGTEVNFKRKNTKKFTDWSLLQFNKLVAVSNYTKSLLPDNVTSRTLVIPNGIECENFGNKSKSISLKGAPKILTVGNVTRRKGQHNVLKAMPHLISHFPTIHYHIVGIPTRKEEFNRLALELGVSEHITFHNKVSSEVLENIYMDCDIFCMLSENQEDGDTEGFGIAILEGNYYGLPTVGSKGCGIEDAVEVGRSGFLVDSHSPEEIANAVVSIVNNYQVLSQNSKEWAIKHDWSKIIQMYTRLLR